MSTSYSWLVSLTPDTIYPSCLRCCDHIRVNRSILFKADLVISVIKIVKDKEGRTLSLLCQFNEKYLFNIICLYAEPALGGGGPNWEQFQ